jgi:hypothetical protein
LGPDRNICLTEIDGPPLILATARQLGDARMAAAVEAEELAGYDQVTIS